MFNAACYCIVGVRWLLQLETMLAVSWDQVIPCLASIIFPQELSTDGQNITEMKSGISIFNCIFDIIDVKLPLSYRIILYCNWPVCQWLSGVTWTRQLGPRTHWLSVNGCQQWYFSFKIHFRFSFYKFFCQSFLFLYYFSIDLKNYFSFYKFLYQSFLFYNISVLPETIISVSSSFSCSKLHYKKSKTQIQFLWVRASLDLSMRTFQWMFVLFRRPTVKSPQTEKIRST